MQYMAFDVKALKAAAVAAVEGAQSVVHMAKLPEGYNNKTFLIVLDNRKEVIVRLPTSYASPPHYSTASEVATMEFARIRLGLPVPRTLSWCSAKGTTAVGAEFIITEKPIGVPVSKVWPKMSQLKRLELVKEVVRIEKAALRHPLPYYGSIFFHRDIAPEKAFAVDDIFSIGPTMEFEFWACERETMNLDRGPWKTPSAYLYALCRREQEWIQLHGSSQLQREFGDYPAVTREPSAHLAVLNHFHSVVPSILPFSVPGLVQPTLWHQGLSGDNVFISDEELVKGRVSITSIIDWRHTWVGPLYTQACVPKVFRYHSPWNLPEGIEIASLPKGMDEMGESDQRAARDDVDAMNLVICYRAMVAKTPLYYHALVEAYTRLFADLALGASLSWNGMFHILRVKILTLQSIWWKFMTTPCPFHVTKEEERTWWVEAEQWQARQDELKEICTAIEMTPEGWVPAEDYEAACDRYTQVKKEWIEKGGLEEVWPFSKFMVDGQSDRCRSWCDSLKWLTRWRTSS